MERLAEQPSVPFLSALLPFYSGGLSNNSYL